MKCEPVQCYTKPIFLQDLRRDAHTNIDFNLMLLLFLVFITVMVEKPSLRRQVVEKGSRAKISPFLRMESYFQQTTINWRVDVVVGASALQSLVHCSILLSNQTKKLRNKGVYSFSA